MILYLIGVDHRGTSLEIREGAYSKRNAIRERCYASRGNAVPLFTCNRIEVYGTAEDEAEAKVRVEAVLSRFPETFGDAYVKIGDKEVIPHALSLASGLVSQLIGEREIIEQLYSWMDSGDMPSLMRRFWDKILDEAVRIRELSGLDRSAFSLADVIMERQEIKDIIENGGKIAVVGTGKVAGLFAANVPETVELYFVARKRHKRARQLANRAGGSSVGFDALPGLLSSTDVLISATSSPHYVIGPGLMVPVAENREKDLLVFDLAVPRDVDPEVRGLSGIVLIDMEDMQTDISSRNEGLSPEIRKASISVDSVAEDVRKGWIEDVAESRNKTEYAGV